ncbi:TldD/PmbA family protein, partial [Mycobacterium tuberculosis]
PEPVYTDAEWVSNYRIDPFGVPASGKIAVLRDYSGRLLDADGIDHVSASLNAVKEQTFYADTFGSSITQQRVRLLPCLDAVAVDSAAGNFESMRTLAPPTARGWEVVAGDEIWNWTDELAQLPSLLAEKVRAPSVMPGPTDLVIDPTNLWLTIHESIGHATEYDRAIGYEAAYAGTSFATPDKLGTLRYGSPVMNVTADRTAEFGLATVGYDDEGVAAQSWDLVRDGVFVGYQLDRAFAPRLGEPRSNGCSYADSPHHVPIQRMANISLQPGIEDLSTADLIEITVTFRLWETPLVVIELPAQRSVASTFSVTSTMVSSARPDRAASFKTVFTACCGSAIAPLQSGFLAHLPPPT